MKASDQLSQKLAAITPMTNVRPWYVWTSIFDIMVVVIENNPICVYAHFQCLGWMHFFQSQAVSSTIECVITQQILSNIIKKNICCTYAAATLRLQCIFCVHFVYDIYSHMSQTKQKLTLPTVRYMDKMARTKNNRSFCNQFAHLYDIFWIMNASINEIDTRALTMPRAVVS